MISDVKFIPNGATAFGAWLTPAMVAGVEYDTINLDFLLQQYITSGNYAEGDPIAFMLLRSPIFFPPGDVNRKFAEFGNATYTTPTRLIVEWSPNSSQVI